MGNTRQSAAISAGDECASIMQDFKALRSRCVDFNRRYVNQNYAGIWSQLPTAPLNPDGTLGTTDQKPVAGDPITVFATANTLGEMTAAVNLIQQFLALLGAQQATVIDGNKAIDDVAR